jgi:hypothetical protein
MALLSDDNNPLMVLSGVGPIDCSDEDNFELVASAFPGQGDTLERAAELAILDIQQGSWRPNPYNRLQCPAQWNAWNIAYSFWLKHALAHAGPQAGEACRANVTPGSGSIPAQ